MARDKNLPAHFVERGDPKINGPHLSDVRADQERAYRETRMKSGGKPISREELTKKATAYLVKQKKEPTAPVEDQPNSNVPSPPKKKTASITKKAPAKKTTTKKAAAGKKK